MNQEEISQLIKEKRWSELKEGIVNLHPVDLASLLSQLEPDERKRIVKMVPHETVENLLPELPKDLLTEVILAFPARKSAQLLSELPPDEMTDVLKDLTPEIRKTVFRHFSKKDSEEARDLLKYPSDTAGGLMTTEVPLLPETLTVKEALAFMREKAKEFETIYYIYLGKKDGTLSGVVSLRDIVLALPNARLIDLGKSGVISVTPDVDQEEVARLIARYDFFALPVVDKEGKLLGMVTVDDVVDVIMDEATEDITRIGGTQPLKESYLFSSPYTLVKSRVVWLLLLFGAATVSSSIIRNFKEVLTSVVTLAFFIPLIIDTGGNTGSQSSTLMIRSMATGEIKYTHLYTIIVRELFVGTMLGLLVAAVGFILALFINVSFMVSVTVATTIIAVVIAANILGATLPLLIKKMGFDPAIVSGPLLTTIVDALGLFIYFTVARMLL
ncbi:magnesium transporter MgtE [archaeon BMS3Abin16]|nr:magnesium transporter MgtE [archaeon BMS3Abin16]